MESLRPHKILGHYQIKLGPKKEDKNAKKLKFWGILKNHAPQILEIPSTGVFLHLVRAWDRETVCGSIGPTLPRCK